MTTLVVTYPMERWVPENSFFELELPASNIAFASDLTATPEYTTIDIANWSILFGGDTMTFDVQTMLTDNDPISIYNALSD